MSFLNPLGLLGLIGIPILIIIYIIKSPFQERAVSSSFIWKLSLKYRKKHQPLQWMNRYLLFVLQILTIVVVSLLLARPVINMGDGSDEEILILDLSASMQAVTDNQSDFEKAVAAIKEQIQDLEEGSKMSIILAGTTSEILISRSASTHDLTSAIDNLTCEYGTSDLAGALNLASEILEENPDAQVTYYTDSSYEETEELQVVDVSGTSDNVAALGLTATEDTDHTYEFSAEVANYGLEDSVTVALYVDDTLVDAQIVAFQENETKTVIFEDTNITEYTDAYVYLETNDSIASDNQYNLYGDSQETYQVQIVSDEPEFLKTLLDSLGNYEVTVVGSSEEAATEGFDLYVYDGVTTDLLPEDGAVWYLNPESLPADTEVVLGTQESGSYTITKAADSDTELFSQLTNFQESSDIALSAYTSVTSYGTLESLYTANASPVILAGTVDQVRMVIFTFDIHDSNLPLKIDFLQMAYLISGFLLPQITEDFVYEVGETVSVNGVSAVSLLTIASSEASESYYEFPVAYEMVAPGVYEISQTLANGTAKSSSFFVHIAEAESDTTEVTLSVDTTVLEVKAEGTVTHYKEIWLYLAILLFILLLIEWEVQYREQY